MKMKNRFLGILLSFVMVLGLMPGMSLTAYAATETYTNLMNNIVKFNNHDWYIIADDSTATGGTITLLAADTSFGTSKFHDSSNAYSSSTVKGVLDALTAEGGAFASVKDAIADTDLTDVNVTGAKLYLLSTSEAEPYKKLKFPGATWDSWWLRSQGMDSYKVAAVNSTGLVNNSGYSFRYDKLAVRPALWIKLGA